MRYAQGWLGTIFFALLVTATRAADAPAPVQYLVEIVITQTHRDGTQSVLAEPRLAVLADRDANYQVGGEMAFGNERIPFGTSVKLRVKPAASGELTIAGMVEYSSVNEHFKDLVSRHTVATYFNRSVTLGKRCRMALEKTAQGERSIEVTVCEAGNKVPQP